MKFRLAIIGLVSTLMAGCSKDSPVSPSLFVPFSGSYAGTIAPTANPFVNLTDATGSSTYLGQGTSKGTTTIGGFDDSICLGGIENVQVYTLTASTGDTLTLTLNDVACPMTLAPGLYRGVGNWYVSGGTGRFKGATGQGTGDGQADLGALKFTVTLSACNAQQDVGVLVAQLSVPD
jgi:hypothetical protein